MLPKAVDQSERHGLTDCLTLNTDSIFATMYGAIQKLQSIVETQETKTNAMYEAIQNPTNIVESKI